jgi:hypothetical protein
MERRRVTLILAITLYTLSIGLLLFPTYQLGFEWRDSGIGLLASYLNNIGGDAFFSHLGGLR